MVRMKNLTVGLVAVIIMIIMVLSGYGVLYARAESDQAYPSMVDIFINI